MKLPLRMFFLVAANLAGCFLVPAFGQASGQAMGHVDDLKIPSKEEVGDLVNKAAEYVQTYRAIFNQAKPSLDKAVPPGFHTSAMQLSDQAETTIAALRKNGSSAYALVAFIAILDDMSLNAAKASAAAMLLAVAGNAPTNRNNPALTDFVSLAQAGKNCSDISELLLHTTLRYTSVGGRYPAICLDHAENE